MTGGRFADKFGDMGRDENWIWPAILIASVTALATLLISVATGYPARPSGQTSFQAAVTIIIVTAFLRFFRYLLGLWKSGVEHPIRRILTDLRPAAIDFAPILAGFSIIAVFFYCLTFLKSMIPVVMPFWSDGLFAAIDRALFIDPQVLAMALEPVMPAIGVFYGLWHFVHLGGILWVLHWRRPEKARYILSFMLIWAIGMTMAYVFSSAGPIFTGRYDPALAPESMREVVRFLWSNYQSGAAKIGAGISAFPSMHIAIATWFAFVLGSRGLKWLGITYVGAMYLCSIILGWHYAVDGVAGIAIAVGSWYLAPVVARQCESLRAYMLIVSRFPRRLSLPN